MIRHILLVLQRFVKNWVFNYEDDVTAELRLNDEIRKLNLRK